MTQVRLERRSLAVEVRAAADGRQLVGYAARFNEPAQIGGRFTETVAPGAFRASLARPGADVLALVDHDPTRILGRTGSGTLRLAEDAQGLRFEIDLPDTTEGRDVLALAERRDLGGMSFGFRVVAEDWPSPSRRVLRAVNLAEISIVSSFPAYAGTTVSARSLGLPMVTIPTWQRRRVLEIL